MLKNYIKIAWRNLWKNKGFTAINILGLTISLTACLLIAFYLIDELSYDKYNSKIDRIYRVNGEAKFGGQEIASAQTAPSLASILKNDYAEVENAVRLRRAKVYYVKKGRTSLREKNILFADADVFDVFTLPFVFGDPNIALKDPNNLVVTESTARKYFNKTNVIGETLSFENEGTFKVTGVIKDIPKTSHFIADFLISMSTRPDSKQTDWLGSADFNTYVILKKGANPQELEVQLQQVIAKYMGPQLKKALNKSFSDIEKSGEYFKLNLIRLDKIHLESNRTGELGQNGSKQHVYLFALISLIILVLACVNYTNISTARYVGRLQDVGVRKLLGSSRSNLLIKFLTESLLITFVATSLALIAAYLLLPVLSNFSGKGYFFSSPSLKLFLLTATLAPLVITLVAGLYPAFFLSGFDPLYSLRGKITSKLKSKQLRDVLVIFQFSISVILIISTLVIYMQLKFIQSFNVGYDRSQVLIIKNISTLNRQAGSFKNEIKQLPGVLNASLTGYIPTGELRRNNSLFTSPVPDAKKALLSQFWEIDKDYLATLQIKLVKGNNFSINWASDSSGILINETTAKLLENRNPVGKTLYFLNDQMKFSGHQIIGVVHDFNISSSRDKVGPVVMYLGKNQEALITRVQSASIRNSIRLLEDKWRQFSPYKRMEYSFMDEDFNAIYQSDLRLGKLFVTLQIRFNAGALTVVDYLIAKNNFERASINLLTSRYDLLIRKKVLDFYQGKV